MPGTGWHSPDDSTVLTCGNAQEIGIGECEALQHTLTLHDHVYKRKWTVENAAGHVRLDTLTGIAELQEVHVTQARSQIVVSGTTELDGSPADLRIQAVRVYGEDLKPYVDRRIAGILAGNLRLTSFDPVKVEGDLRADNLQIDDRSVGNARGHLRFFDPAIDLESASVARNGSTLSGNVTFNQSTEALKFSARVASVDFDSVRWLGIPDALNGVIRQADLQGDGSLRQPNVRGIGAIQNLAFTFDFNPDRLSLSEVTLTGESTEVSVEASGGTLTFQGKRYTITRGNVDFVDPLRIEPVVDVQAETEIRDYRVILAISGRRDRLHVEMRSDPPLPQIEIVNLVSGGKTRADPQPR